MQSASSKKKNLSEVLSIQGNDLILKLHDNKT
jgi:hypothetical protein